MANNKMHPGCLIALIVAGVLVVLVLGSVAAFGYFLSQTFEIKEHAFSDETVAEVPAEVMSAEEASAAAAASVH